MAILNLEKVPRNDPYYQACLAVSTVGGTAIGMTLGSATLPVVGTVAGWASGMAFGFVAGYLACPYLAPGMRRKIEQNLPMSALEVGLAADAMARYANVYHARDALKLLAISKAARVPAGAKACVDPNSVAKQLLRS